MTDGLARVARSMLAVLIVAVFWVLLFRLNGLLFASVRHTRWADWIFLPAAVRIVAVLLLGRRGAAGLIFGAWLTLGPEDAHHLPQAVFLPLSSGLAPLVAVGTWRRLTGLRDDLVGLRPSDVAGLALGCAVANSTLLNFFLTLSGDSRQDTLQIVTIIVGDAAGIMLVLLPLAILLSLQKARSGRPSSGRDGPSSCT